MQHVDVMCLSNYCLNVIRELQWKLGSKKTYCGMRQSCIRGLTASAGAQQQRANKTEISAVQLNPWGTGRTFSLSLSLSEKYTVQNDYSKSLFTRYIIAHVHFYIQL